MKLVTDELSNFDNGDIVMCDRVKSMMQNAVNETIKCIIENDDHDDNDMGTIVSMLIAPVLVILFACLTVSLLLMLLFITGRALVFFSKTYSKCTDDGFVPDLIEESGTIVPLEATIPSKPPRY